MEINQYFSSRLLEPSSIAAAYMAPVGSFPFDKFASGSHMDEINN